MSEPYAHDAPGPHLIRNGPVSYTHLAVAMKAAGLGIPKVENIGPTENVTDNARYRPNART